MAAAKGLVAGGVAARGVRPGGGAAQWLVVLVCYDGGLGSG